MPRPILTARWASAWMILVGLALLGLYFLNDNPNKRFPIWGLLVTISSIIGIGQAAMNSSEDD